MHRVLDFLRTRDIPLLARPNYAAELRHMSLWGLFANLVDGSFSSIVVAKTFGVPLLVPVVWATPMVAHLFNFAWSLMVRGRRKVRTFMVLALGAVLCAGSIAFTPSDWHPWGGWLFAGQVALARIFLSGLVTVRTAMWRANYPQSHRARIAGRIQALSALLMLAMGATVSLLFDRHAEYYRLVYPAIAVLGVLALLPLRRLRIRGERRDLARLRSRLHADGTAAGRPGTRFPHGLHEALGILKRDRAFARYCSAQYLLGSANFMVDPVLTIILTQAWGFGYFGSYLLLEQIPTVLSLLTIRHWAPLFDRIGVLRFRVINSIFWLASVALVTAGLLISQGGPAAAAALATTMLVTGRIANGIARGGGTIAWNLGHLHFAGEHDSELYMGIHVALTGLRGLIMPFVGAAMYELLGPGALLIALGLTTTALLAFRRLARMDGRGRPGPTPSGELLAARTAEEL